MDPRRLPRSRASIVPFAVLAAVATLVALAGCSGRPHEIVGPSRTSSSPDIATAAPSFVLAPPLVIDRWKSPRISLWTDGWKRVQGRPGVSLDPDRIEFLEVPEGRAVTFHWSARPMSAQGAILGYRWAVDLEDILDETPRSVPGDVTRWSAWSATETSATVGPFAAGSGSHLFYIEARDDFGFLSLLVVELRPGPAPD